MRLNYICKYGLNITCPIMIIPSAKIKLFFVVLFCTSIVIVNGQKRMTVDEYIIEYKDIAIKKMKEYKIPASITIAQGILESGSGNSQLTRRANNHFGIKCHKDWKGKTFYMDDDEKHECFRKYKTPEESYRDHSIFLTARGRYADLFNLKITDYKAWAYGLKKAGYATNPKYPQLLIKIIEDNKLYKYDTKQPVEIAKKNKRTPQVIGTTSTVFIKPLVIKGTVLNNFNEEREVLENNGVKYIYAKANDNFEIIAEDFNIYPYQIYKYNNLKKKDELSEGQVLYIEKKKRKHSQKHHVIQEGETMYYISQFYAVRLNVLYKKNTMNPGMEPTTGRKMKLK